MRHGVELAGYHAQPKDGRPPTQDRHPAQHRARQYEQCPARDVEDAHDVEPAAPPAALVEAVAFSETQTGSAAREVVPVPPDALDHGAADAFACLFASVGPPSRSQGPPFGPPPPPPAGRGRLRAPRRRPPEIGAAGRVRSRLWCRSPRSRTPSPPPR